MTNSTITFFPVGEKNGGMTLIKLNDQNNTTMLIDCSIETELIADYCNVNQELRDRLPSDEFGRPYIDAFILTHRHEDHLKGLPDHFHLGSLNDYNDDEESLKIVIRELWSSSIFWKSETENYSLCDNAKSFNKEMRRRVSLYENSGKIQEVGDRAIIIGKDPSGKTDDFDGIVYGIGDTFSTINNRNIASKLKGVILGPIEQQEDEPDKDYLDHNRQSIIIQLTITETNWEGYYENKILMAADAECLVWETLWNRYKNDTSKLIYDILYAPHHCSWHSLSYDSQSKDENPQICEDAKNALSQKRIGSFIVSQSKIISNNDDDPPSVAAKKEYQKIVGDSQFICTNEYPGKEEPEPLEFYLTPSGPQKRSVKARSKLSAATAHSTRESYPHG
ncbi:MAG: hypothetical protein LBR10_07030 [Prevotellaceae bacterium]|jgi:hypothetical protein|nr:hypothetical protein [Prevotellaceae bacterium]